MATQQQTKAGEESRTATNRDAGSRSMERRQPQRGSSTGMPFGFGPFALLRRMQEDIDRMFGGALNQTSGRSSGRDASATQGLWMPAIETLQRANDFVIRVDLPGVAPADVTVEIGDDAVTIRGERREVNEEERDGVYASEVSYGSFVRVVPLPPGAIADDAQAVFNDGVLEIVVPAPSQEAQRGRRIDIQQGSQSRQQGAMTSGQSSQGGGSSESRGSTQSSQSSQGQPASGQSRS
jgi:HSP20 family protein